MLLNVKTEKFFIYEVFHLTNIFINKRLILVIFAGFKKTVEREKVHRLTYKESIKRG